MSAPQPSAAIVIGAGPVGLATALLLAGAGHRVTVYEGRSEIPTEQTNSYPIGVNARGQEAFRRIDPALHDRLVRAGAVIEGWRIHAGQRRVAELESGTVLAATRGEVNDLLLEAAREQEAITLITGHRLTAVSIATRQLIFETPSGRATVEAADARVIAADGVRSVARTAMTEQVPGFAPEVSEWGVRFRVLFSQAGATAPGMDPYWHYIFGDKGVYSATLHDQVWTVATTARTGSADEELLLAAEATEENLRRLQDYVRAAAAPTAPLLTRDDYVAYFSRDSFSGAVVRCPFLHVEEWLVLIGDAAHSVLPPTGEGLNSGLEDSYLLVEHLLSGSATPFADYNAHRMPDLTALGEYAWTLMENIKSTDPARRTTNLILRIAGTLGQKVGLKGNQVEQRLFGPDSGLTPYREIFADWIVERNRVYPRLFGLVRGGYALAERLRRHRAPTDAWPSRCGS
ncbi:MAG: FAD-dependent oxidoreductase [Propioniciclava sp.]